MTEFGLEDLESDGKLEEFNKNLWCVLIYF
jgi:hypothetical protein